MWQDCSAVVVTISTVLTVGATADPRYSRMTVVVNGDEQILDQIEKQVRKLVDVADVKTLKAW